MALWRDAAEDLTAETLTGLLRDSGHLDRGEVTSLELQTVRETDYSVARKLGVTYSIDATPGLPVDLFLKAGEHSDEYYFHRCLAPALGGSVTPMCFGSARPRDEGSDGSLVLLEDVSDTHHTPPDDLPPTWPDPETAVGIVDAFAGLHALVWGDWQLGQDSHGRNEYRPLGEMSQSLPDVTYRWAVGLQPNATGLRKGFSDNQEAVGGLYGAAGNRVPERLKGAFERVSAGLAEVLVDRHASGKHLTFTHRDTNIWNIMVPRETSAGPVYLIDWSNTRIRVGPSDLGNHIARFWSPEVRREVEEGLVRRYHDRLMAEGIGDYSWEDCWRDYRLGVLEELYNRTRPRLYRNWDETGWRIFGNVLAAYEELNCDELLG